MEIHKLTPIAQCECIAGQWRHQSTFWSLTQYNETKLGPCIYGLSNCLTQLCYPLVVATTFMVQRRHDRNLLLIWMRCPEAWCEMLAVYLSRSSWFSMLELFPFECLTELPARRSHIVRCEGSSVAGGHLERERLSSKVDAALPILAPVSRHR